jgi:hypothetical protein
MPEYEQNYADDILERKVNGIAETLLFSSTCIRLLLHYRVRTICTVAKNVGEIFLLCLDRLMHGIGSNTLFLSCHNICYSCAPTVSLH